MNRKVVMILFRCLPVFVIFLIGANGQENHETDPCGDDGEPTPPASATLNSTTKTSTTAPTTNSTTTTTNTTTTKKPLICNGIGFAFKRANGWWCTWFLTATDHLYYPYDLVKSSCELNGWVVSSIESEEERAAYDIYIKTVRPEITGFFVATAYNTSSKSYYWNDGHALPKAIDPQPRGEYNPSEEVAWVINTNTSAPEFGYLVVRNVTGIGSPTVNSGLCGYPSKI